MLVKLEHAGAISTLTMNRPEKLNALDMQVIRELEQRLVEIDARPETRCVVVTGEGKAFVAGADISAMKDLTQAEAEAFASEGQGVFAHLEALSCPVIAAVNGFALGGGCELALACDFIVASEKAKFGQPEVKLGVIPGFGGTQRLSRRVGVGMARELCYTGRIIGADEALRIGLLNRISQVDALVSDVNEIASEIAAAGPLAVAACKRVILAGEGVPLPVANAREAKLFGELFASADQTEGMGAFVEKRSPAFAGK